jgi:glycosyltransferase involved in cell wall biosynthesis
VKILMIVPGGVHESGKVCVIPALLALIRRLAMRNEVTVAALRQYREPKIYELLGARVLNLGYMPFPPLNYLLWKRYLKKIVRREKNGFDVVHAIWLDEPGPLAVMVGREFNIPVVASLGGGELVNLPEIGYGGQRRWFFRRHVRDVLASATVVTAGSRYAVKDLDKASWVPLFPETDHLLDLPRPEEGPPWRLLQAASVNRVKDPSTLLEAMELITKKTDAHLDWVGEDTLGGRMKGEHVSFHGFKEYDRLPDFYRQAHLYVQSSLHESQGVAVCEAAAAGVPVVGTGVGLLNELSPERAKAVTPGNAVALADAVTGLLRDEERRLQMSVAARAWMADHGADWTAGQFESIYSGCVP